MSTPYKATDAQATKKKEDDGPYEDDTLLTIIEKQVNLGVGFCDSKLSKEREKVIKYYNSTLPAQQGTGNSSYRSTDVYDSVEAMKAQLLETFSGNPDGMVSFPPLQPNDVKTSRVATDYCSYQIFELNEGYDVFQTAIHDGLTSRVGVTKVYWEEDYEEVEEHFHSLSEDDVHALAANEDISELEATETTVVHNVGSGLYNGTLTRRIDRSKVMLLPVPPEEFIIARNAPSLRRSRMTCHRTLKGKDELKKEGYDKAKVDSINWSDARSLDLTGEKLERSDQVSDFGTVDNDESFQKETDKVMFYETYVRMDMRDGKGVKLWKVCHAGRVLLSKEEVDRAPFVVFVPLPIPHIFHGNNFGHRVIPTQNARTVLTRAILDHASVTTKPRYTVLKGGLLNPKEMLDNRLGGLVNINRPDAVQPLLQGNLNPFVFQTLELLKQNKEESTGISSLSQGLNKDAISTQNSAALVDNLVTLSQQRQKIIARNFAFGYLVPLYLEVYRLVLENEKAAKVVEIAGDFERIDPQSWSDRRQCRVALHLGYGERDRQAGKIMEAYMVFSKDPSVATLFSPTNRYSMLTDAMKAAQLENWPSYLTPPEKAPQPQPDAMKVRELDIKDKTATAALVGAQSKAQNDQGKLSLEAMRVQIDKLRMQLDAMLGNREADRQDADVMNRIDIGQRETVVLENTPKVNAIASPNS